MLGDHITEKENGEPSDVQNTSAGEAEKKDQQYRDTKIGLTLRILVSAYVLYLAYGLIQNFGETAGNDRIFIAAAIVIFLVAGGAIMVLSAKKLIRKEYVDADGQAENDEEE